MIGFSILQKVIFEYCLYYYASMSSICYDFPKLNEIECLLAMLYLGFLNIYKFI